ncbi:MAG TPA: ABC transporter ATP-binding protein [Gemmatimonadaceae bacterium]|jgi:ABC-type multidrug transport system fused ATPase/permease subunit|nr:ABC transporter ATP-binding protein [Gemmatimonadaceae bacterium]
MPIRDALAELRTLVWRYRGALTAGLALMLANRLAAFALPALSKVVVDQVIAHRRLELLAPVAAAGVAAVLLEAATAFASSRVLGIAGHRVVNDLRTNLFARVLDFPLSFFDNTSTGSLVSRIMADTVQVENLIGSGLVQFIGAITTAVLGFALLLKLDWLLTVVVTMILLLSAAWGTRAFSGLYATFNEHGEAHALATARLTETLGGIAVVKAYAAERHESLAFTARIEQLFDWAKRGITGVARLDAGTNVINGSLTLLLVVVGGWLVLYGQMTVGDLLVFIMLVALLAMPFQQIAVMGSSVGKSLAALGRVRELRMRPGEDADDAQRSPLEHVVGNVTFEGVCYAYAPGELVLRYVDFEATVGSTVALVGSSGSGKSTLCRLLMAFDRPSLGRILIDGRDLSRVRLRDYRSRLGVVLQDNFLFDGTIRDNIMFAARAATDAEVCTASRLAHCDEFVSRFPAGYDTIVGERGVKLSGGQRQRIAIARAILANPRILILDEATSNLDSESESLIRDGLAALRAGRTTFVIAHRLSTIESADQILVLDGGRIVERGTHSVLMALSGRYRRLHDTQYAKANARTASGRRG